MVVLSFSPHGHFGENVRGMTLYQDKGTRMGLSQAFCQYVLHRVRSMLTSSALSAKEALMGILMLLLEWREGWINGAAAARG